MFIAFVHFVHSFQSRIARLNSQNFLFISCVTNISEGSIPIIFSSSCSQRPCFYELWYIHKNLFFLCRFLIQTIHKFNRLIIIPVGLVYHSMLLEFLTMMWPNFLEVLRQKHKTYLWNMHYRTIIYHLGDINAIVYNNIYI